MILLGQHPDTGLPVYVIRSPFGPYIQCGDATDSDPTPQGCWLPSCWDIGDVSLDIAIELLSFPRVLGQHPVTGVDVVIHLQQSGPAIRSEIVIHGTQRHCVTKLEPLNEVLEFTLDRAVELLDQVVQR